MATIIPLGPDGPGIAAEHLKESPPTRVSNCQGEGLAAPGGGGPALNVAEKPRTNIGVPLGPPKKERKKQKMVPNYVRIWVREVYGHHYGYFDALDANDLDELHVLEVDQVVLIPPRGKKGNLAEAEKWRERLSGCP
ncbi:MAG: hypothetical protein PVH29_10015 [Candidatus Zixiibacteriota bacterium]|jgi:hypothetical protein